MKSTLIFNYLASHLDKSHFKGDADAKEALDESFSALAWTLRSLSVDAYNDERNTEMALEIIELARQLAKDPDLQKRIADDVK